MAGLAVSPYFLKFLILFCFLHNSFLKALASLPSNSSYIFPNEALPTKSGYISVNPTNDSAMFYAFYEAKTPTSPLSQTPLVFWLQGGPGCSSMIGNFLELGPYRLAESPNDNISLVLEPNSGSWNRIFGVVFLDNPIGAGFSIASKPEEIPRNQTSVAEHLLTAISGFIEQDPTFKTRPLYIAGESYAGKYVPAIGYHILQKNMKLPLPKKLNLKGVAVGNGMTDPITQVQTHALNAYYLGLVNDRQKGELEEAQREAVELVTMEKWSEATDARNKVLRLLSNMTGLATLYDYTKKAPYKTSYVTKFFQSVEVKKAVGGKESVEFVACSDVVNNALHADVMKSVKYMVEFLVKNSKVLLYQGQFDLRDGPVAIEAWIKTLKWEGLERFMMAERKVWKVNGEVAGYLQKWGGLSHTVVLGAGHFVPTDQAVNSQGMIEDWILDKGSFSYQQNKDE